MTRRFAKMTARYRGKCAQCGEHLNVGDPIYYSRPDAYCAACGEMIFEPADAQQDLPMPVATVEPEKAAPAPAQTEGNGFPLTMAKCYCHIVRRKCGVCLAKSLR